MRFGRRLYDWVLRWAETPHALPALFLLAVAESSFFPVPPDVLLITLALAVPSKSFRFAAICSVGSVAGGIIGYGIGMYGYEAIGRAIVEFYNAQPVMEAVGEQYARYGFWGILIAAVTPIPYKVFTIASGVFKFDFGLFLAASIVGRSARFFVVAALIWKIGPAVRVFIDRYFNLLSYLFILLLIAGFLIVKYAF